MTPPRIIIASNSCVCGDPDCVIPYGYCHCKCGGRTEISTYGNRALGYFKGQPKPLIKGHQHWKYAQSAADYFWERVDKNGPVMRQELSKCWLWIGHLNHLGYGICRHKELGDTPRRAYRVSYEIHNGSIPAGLLVRHICDNPPCVRPDHLLLGTQKDNNEDARVRRRIRSGESHHGARFTESQVLDIRREFSEGNLTQYQIAAKYGVSRATIAGITQGKAWKYAGTGSVVQ